MGQKWSDLDTIVRIAPLRTVEPYHCMGPSVTQPRPQPFTGTSLEVYWERMIKPRQAMPHFMLLLPSRPLKHETYCRSSPTTPKNLSEDDVIVGHNASDKSPRARPQPEGSCSLLARRLAPPYKRNRLPVSRHSRRTESEHGDLAGFLKSLASLELGSSTPTSRSMLMAGSK